MDTLSFSPSALKQIKKSAQESDNSSMGLRFAARMTADESVDYGIGFDEAKEDDIKFVDFVEIEEGQFHFIFLNPNDPNYKPPSEKSEEK